MTCTKTISELVSELTPVIREIVLAEMFDLAMIVSATTFVVGIFVYFVLKAMVKDD